MKRIYLQDHTYARLAVYGAYRQSMDSIVNELMDQLECVRAKNDADVRSRNVCSWKDATKRDTHEEERQV